jgi:hypothetical protein
MTNLIQHTFLNPSNIRKDIQHNHKILLDLNNSIKPR